MCFLGKPEGLSLVAINMNKTACVTFTFLDVFFSSYWTKGVSQTSCTCKVSMKTIAGIFRGQKEKKVSFQIGVTVQSCFVNLFETTVHKETKHLRSVIMMFFVLLQLEMCKIDYEMCDTKITIKVKYKQDVSMTHVIKLIECNHPNIKLPESCCNQMTASGNFYNQILVMFQHNDEEVSWDVGKTRAVARNYNETGQNCLKVIRTKVALNAAEFATYKVQEECEITFSLRPFRAAIHFAEALNLSVTINFISPGK